MRRKFIIADLVFLSWLSIFTLSGQIDPDCSFITDNYSGQVTTSRCAPLTMTMEVEYRFMFAVDSNQIRVLYVWNDGTPATDTIDPISQGDTLFTANMSHLYLPSAQCSYTAEAFILVNDEVCSSSSLQEQTFSAWGRDNENSGELFISQPEVLICEGDDVDTSFSDQSTFNCNINIEPDKPNRMIRWVQFIYNTDTGAAATLIPDASVVDNNGNIYPLTNAAGNAVNTQYGPIIPIPIPADGPNQDSWQIIAPPNGVNGDYIQITMRNWNICNPYDNDPYDGTSPGDTINGHNPPIETTAYIRIITTPPSPANPSVESCVNDPVTLSAGSGNTIRWYADSTYTTLLQTGMNFNPLLPPTNLDNSVPGIHTYYVTDAIGFCESTPHQVDLTIYDNPTGADAGTNQFICSDSTFLQGNSLAVGTGMWTTSGSATIVDPTSPTSKVTNLEVGLNTFTWTTTNGPCTSVDNVSIYRDLQPAPAFAGNDTAICDATVLQLYADPVTNGGTGNWAVIQGGGSFVDQEANNTFITGVNQGINVLTWEIESANGGCSPSTDTIILTRDLDPAPALAGADQELCETPSTVLSGNTVTNNGSGSWAVLNGSAVFADSTNPASSISGLSYGINQLIWTIESEFGVCPTTTDTMAINRLEMPVTADAGNDQSLCSVTLSDTLKANDPSAGNGFWQIISAPAGSTPSFIPDNLSNNAQLEITPGYEGNYTLTWNIENGTCTTSDTVNIDFGVVLPPAYAGPDTTLCGLNINLQADIPTVGEGTWSIVSGNGTAAISDIHDPNATLGITVGNAGKYILEWLTLSGSCSPQPVHRDSVEIYFKPVPFAPAPFNEEICGAGSLELYSPNTINATTSRWYDSITGNNLLFTDSIFATPVVIASRSFYVSAYNDTAMCESSRVPVNITVNQVPGLPVTQDVQNCGGDSITLNALVGANGLTNRWFTNDTSELSIATGNVFKTPYLNNSSSYWVSSYHDSTGCESNRTEVKITIDSIPHLPIVGDTSRCGAGSFELTSVQGTFATSNRWYDQQNGGILLTTSNNYITNHLTATTSFFVSAYNDTTGCESERIGLTASIEDLPGLPLVGDTSICGYDTIVLTGAPGTDASTLRWYSEPGGNNALFTGNTFETPYLTSTVSYWVSSYNATTGCEGPRKQIDIVIKDIPQTTPIQGYQFVRLDQENVVYSVDYHTGSTYNWSIPPTIDKINEVDNFVILGFPNLGVQDISVTETANNGCEGPPQEKQITVTNEVINITIEDPDAETCHGNNIFLNIVPTGGNAPYFYNWSGDSSYLSDTKRANPVFDASAPGVYKLNVHVWDIDNNHAYDTMTVRVYNTPAVKFNPDETYVCKGSDYLLKPTITGGTGPYNLFMWTGNTVGLSSPGIRAPVFNSNIENDFEMILTVMDSKSCMGRDTFTIHNVSPKAGFTVDATPSCSPATYCFNNESEGASTYLWDFDDGNSSNDTNICHTFYNTSPSVTYYQTTLTAIDVHGCESTETKFITIYPNPDHSFSVSPQNGCDPLQAVITSAPGGFTYLWDYGDGITEFGNYGIFHEFRNLGTGPIVYNISLVAESFFGCKDTFYNSLTVNPSPKADFIATPESQMYPDATVFLKDVPTGDYQYFWEFGDDEKSTDANPNSHEYLYPGNYEISLKMIGEYCSDSTTKRVTILPHPPIAKFKKIEPGCMPHTVQFQNESSYADTYLWEFGDGAVSSKPDPVYTYYEAGVYKIKLTATSKEGLKSQSSDVGNVWVLPNSFFDLAPKIVFVNDEAVHFFNLSDNGDVYEWDFGDGENSTDFEAQHLYTSPGTYDVSLKVWTNDGCFDLYEMKSAVLVEESGKIVFPNVIKPLSNIDQNQTFRPAVLDDVEEYHLIIYNRWGELIFETKDPNEGWNGHFDGKPVKSDVYVWKLKGKYINGRAINKVGDVTVMY